LTELEGQGLNLVANALAQSTDHVLSFFRMLRAELAFYLGCLHLQERLAEKGEPVCFPEPLPPGEPVLTARGLYDVCLALTLDGRTVGNDVDADGRNLVMITGANQGGKLTSPGMTISPSAGSLLSFSCQRRRGSSEDRAANQNRSAGSYRT
jgi:DNA mismatch repair ATPase MutS